MIVGTPRPSSPTIRAQAPRNSTSEEAFERLPSLSFRRWMWKRLRSPSGVNRGSRKQESPPSAWARTRKASHIGAEQNHLCPVISYSAPAAAAVQGRRGRGVRAHVRAALLLGHRHAADRPRLVRGRAKLAVVVEREEARLPLGRDVRLLSQRRNHRVGHRDRAANPGLRLREAHEAGRARDVGARLGLAPRQRVQPEADPLRHQLVPGRVEIDLVDAVPEAVVRLQRRLVLVRLTAPALGLCGAGEASDLADLLGRPLGAFAAQCLDQHAIGLEDVVAFERRGLVEDLVRGALAALLKR